MRALILLAAAGLMLSGCVPEIKNEPLPLPAQAKPSDLGACAMLPAQGGEWYVDHVSKSLTLADGRPGFRALVFVRNLAEAQGRCDFIFQSESTMDDINTWGTGYTARLGLYSARDGRPITQLALNVSGGDTQVYHALFQAVRPGTSLYAALTAERGR